MLNYSKLSLHKIGLTNSLKISFVFLGKDINVTLIFSLNTNP